MCLKTPHLMKLWKGWHNTGQDRPYFHYGPLGSIEKQMENTGTNIHEAGNEKWLSGNFFILYQVTPKKVLLFDQP